MATSATPGQHTERPWHRRSVLWEREAEVRRELAAGYSLAQIIRRLGLEVSRSTLWRWVRRADAALDGAVLSALDDSGFTPAPSRSRTQK
jgi:transposase